MTSIKLPLGTQVNTLDSIRYFSLLEIPLANIFDVGRRGGQVFCVIRGQ